MPPPPPAPKPLPKEQTSRHQLRGEAATYWATTNIPQHFCQPFEEVSLKSQFVLQLLC